MPQIRLALPQDEGALMEHCRLIHQEVGILALDEDLARSRLRRAIGQDGGIIAVIGESQKLEASLVLLISGLWYSRSHFLEEVWTFVHPDYRRSTHAKDLLGYAKRCADDLGLMLNIGIFNNVRTEAKVRLYQRQLGAPVGAFFFYGLQNADGPAANLKAE